MFSPDQVDPTSIAAEDGRIREGDQIIQVNILIIRTSMLECFELITIIIVIK